MMRAEVLVVLLLSAYTCDAARILVVFPFPGKSHSILGEAQSRLLVDAGHEVTFITPYPTKDPPPKLHLVNISSIIDVFPSGSVMNFTEVIENGKNPNSLTQFFNILLSLNNETFQNENMKKFMYDPTQQFDVIIIEWLFSDFFSGLSAVFDCPYIWFSSVEPHWVVLELIDEALNPSYNADCIFGIIPPFTFLQRVQQLFMQVAGYLLREVFLIRNERTDYEVIYGDIIAKRGKTYLPPYDVVRYNASLMLGNSHPSLGVATRLPQSYKAIGGYHVNPDVKPLPEDLEKLMKEAKNGVIYFSMGSNLKSKNFPDFMKKDLLKMFGSLKYTVIWKFEEKLDGLPDNVHIVHWAPQPSILSHPKCILFITHGGLLSTTEVVHFGKPIIGIPVFADQYNNVDRSVNKGFGKRVNLSFKLADDLRDAIEDILSNPSYAAKAKELSFIYHDRPVPPGREMVHWVEHVINTRGAPHLRSPALDVPLYQKLYLDLAAIVLAVLYALKLIFRLLFSKKKTTANEKKKKNQ